MIVRERTNDFVMIEQHHHALLSGQFARQWGDDFFEGFSKKADVLWAVSEHDRAWIDLDAYPLWNDAVNAPFSFIDLPSALKLPHYKQGIDYLERENAYAAFLCSMHYASFFAESTNPAELVYRSFELDRQQRLRNQLPDVTVKEWNFHFSMLKFLDQLSLYVCFNEPGVAKEDEISMYRDGFVKSEHFSFASGKSVVAYWMDKRRIGLTAFPFKGEFEVSVSLRIVNKSVIQQHGLAEAYKKASPLERTVQIESTVVESLS